MKATVLLCGHLGKPCAIGDAEWYGDDINALRRRFGSSDVSGGKMTKQVEIVPTGPRRKPVAPKVSSGERGLPMDVVLQHYEEVSPAAAKQTGISSAAMRAGTIVRGMRRTAHFSQAELAERIGVSQARISEIEIGEGPQGPTFALLERIGAACGMVLVAMKPARAAALQEDEATSTLA